VSREVIDRNGKSVGYVETAFKDRESGRPEWLGVMTGTWRNHHRLVPATDDLGTSTGTLTIPWTKEQVGAAPEYDELDHPISEKLEKRLTGTIAGSLPPPPKSPLAGRAHPGPTIGSQNVFAADFHSRRRCAMSSARSSSLPPSSTSKSERSARR
jgi:hypothetical protein